MAPCPSPAAGTTARPATYHRRRALARLVALLAAASLAGAVLAARAARDRQEKRDLALIAAVKRHDAQAVVRLLADGADPNAQPTFEVEVGEPRGNGLRIGPRRMPTESLLNRLRRWLGLPPLRRKMAGRGEAPLQIAAVSRDVGVARILLDHGARVDLRFGGTTPLKRALHSAVFIAHTHGEDSSLRPSLRAYVALMLRHGADPNATSFDCTTPLSVAERLADRQVIAMLVRAGAASQRQTPPCGGLVAGPMP